MWDDAAVVEADKAGYTGTGAGTEETSCEWLPSPDADVYHHAFGVEGEASCSLTRLSS